MFNPIRTLLTLTVEVAEALLHLVDFNEAADELWYSERLAEKEAEEEVHASGATFFGAKVFTTDALPPHVPGIQVDGSFLESSSVAPSPVPAADELPSSCSVSNQDVEREEGLQLTRFDLSDLSEAARLVARHHAQGSAARTRWYDLSAKTESAARSLK